MRKIILNLHIYGGLLCFSYLIIFGLSSIMMNHDLPARPQSAEADAKLVKGDLEQPGPLPNFQPINSTLSSGQRDERMKQNNEKVRTVLGLFGWQRPWRSQWDSPPYKAFLVRPGKSYTVEVDVENQKMKVLEVALGNHVHHQGVARAHGVARLGVRELMVLLYRPVHRGCAVRGGQRALPVDEASAMNCAMASSCSETPLFSRWD